MRLLILGGGVSGRSAAGLGRRLGYDVEIFETDGENAQRLREEGFEVISDPWAASMLDGVDVVVTSPGLAESSDPIVETLSAGVPLMSEIEWASRVLRAPYAAVTGTNGKTTVTALIAEILAASELRVVAAGNIGLGLSEVADQEWDRVVIEVSSFQLRFIDSFRPAVAVLLNVADDHLDWHGSYEAYAAAKARIFENAGNDDVLIFDVDDAGAARVAARASGRVIPVSGRKAPEGGYGVRDGALITIGTSIPLTSLRVADAAYLLDMTAAAVAAESLSASPEAVRKVLMGFQPGHHRRTRIGAWGEVTWINDSKATNPHAAVAACEAYRSVILIAGGRNKGLDLAPMTEVPSIKYLIALGEAAPQLLANWNGQGVLVGSLDDAVVAAAAVAEPGDTVLLAPGCASFDMFTSYEARGEAFEAAVKSFQGGTA